jgi:hypothetical protein
VGLLTVIEAMDVDAAWIINLQAGRLASGVSVVHHKPTVRIS